MKKKKKPNSFRLTVSHGPQLLNAIHFVAGLAEPVTAYKVVFYSYIDDRCKVGISV